MSVANISIRKALEKVLYDTLVTATFYFPGTTEVAVAWPDLPLDVPKLMAEAKRLGVAAEYVRFSFHAAKPAVREIGRTPRIEQSGIAKIAIFTQAGTGQDRSDTIAGIVEAAYPYANELVKDGFRVRIDTIDPDDFLTVGAWGSQARNINWNVWRAA